MFSIDLCNDLFSLCSRINLYLSDLLVVFVIVKMHDRCESMMGKRLLLLGSLSI